MKSLKGMQTRLFISLYREHRTEMLQWCCYNNGNDRFSWSDCNDFIMCDRDLSKISNRQYFVVIMTSNQGKCGSSV